MALSFSDIVLADPNCVAYWPLTSDGTDLKGGNTMILTDVVFVDGAAYFNGTTSVGVTGAITFPAVKTQTLIANIRVPNFTTAEKYLYNKAWAANGSVILYYSGQSADTPTTAGGKGNIGTVSATYNSGVSKFKDKNWHFSALTFDQGLATDEVNYYEDGLLLTATSRVNINNTADVVALALTIAKYSTVYAEMYASNIAIFSRILTGPEIATLYLSLQENTTKQGIITKVMLSSGYANYTGIAGKLHGYDLIGGTSLSSVIFKNGGSSGTTLWKDSVKLQAAIGDNTARIRFREPIIFSDDIYVTLAGTGAYVNVIYESLK